MPSPVVPEPPSTKTVAGFLAAPDFGAFVGINEAHDTLLSSLFVSSFESLRPCLPHQLRNLLARRHRPHCSAVAIAA